MSVNGSHYRADFARTCMEILWGYRSIGTKRGEGLIPCNEWVTEYEQNYIMVAVSELVRVDLRHVEKKSSPGDGHYAFQFFVWD